MTEKRIQEIQKKIASGKDFIGVVGESYLYLIEVIEECLKEIQELKRIQKLEQGMFEEITLMQKNEYGSRIKDLNKIIEGYAKATHLEYVRRHENCKGFHNCLDFLEGFEFPVSAEECNDYELFVDDEAEDCPPTIQNGIFKLQRSDNWELRDLGYKLANHFNTDKEECSPAIRDGIVKLQRSADWKFRDLGYKLAQHFTSIKKNKETEECLRAVKRDCVHGQDCVGCINNPQAKYDAIREYKKEQDFDFFPIDHDCGNPKNEDDTCFFCVDGIEFCDCIECECEDCDCSSDEERTCEFCGNEIFNDIDTCCEACGKIITGLDNLLNDIFNDEEIEGCDCPDCR